ncbi:MAG: HAD family hydrolase [Patescibacteria group bacterium]
MLNFVYFDVGGVVIKDFSKTNKWNELQDELGITSEKKPQFEKFWRSHESERCIGGDVEELIPLLNKELGLSIPSNYSLLDGFVKRFEQNTSLWPAIERIKQSCRVGLLTNMYPRMLPEIIKRNLLPPVEWDIIVDSSIEKCQKPEPKIFEIAEYKARVRGNKILFVENSEKHIEAAKKRNWHTFLYNPADTHKSNEALYTLFRSLR